MTFKSFRSRLSTAVRYLVRAAMGGAILSHPAQLLAQASFADPAGSGAIVNAVQWMQGTLMGTLATVVAVIAIAVVGMMMLTGRMNWRYGATVILGCFILFGAVSIVSGIRSVTAAY